MSRQELARLATVHVNVVKRYETGKTDIRLTTLEKFVLIFREHGVIFLTENQAYKMGVALV